MEEGRSAFKILTGKPTGKRPLERPRRRWEENIRMDLREILYIGFQALLLICTYHDSTDHVVLVV